MIETYLQSQQRYQTLQSLFLCELSTSIFYTLILTFTNQYTNRCLRDLREFFMKTFQFQELAGENGHKHTWLDPIDI